MNKTELIEAMADSADISKAAAARAMDGMIDAITKAMQNGDTVSILGFGTFSVRARAARTGRNPKTGEPMEISASRSPAFKAGKAFKDAVN
ncbi:MAG: HU family DNA-binding protein [Pseudomonadales bacterium]|nr:HU family DNA-binding protein [Pseudomonadales bacterium]